MESSTAKKLYDSLVVPAQAEYARQLSKLQNACSHKELSDWMDEQWAPTHGTGYQVQHCENCDAEIHRRTNCTVCGKRVRDAEINKFTMEMLKESREKGETINLPINAAYCAKCFASGRTENPSETVSKIDPPPVVELLPGRRKTPP